MTTAELEQRCKKTIEHLKKDMQKLRSGRASAGLIDSVQVDYYGSTVPIMQMGLINTPEPRLITVQVYDVGAVEVVEKAIRNADLGLNPSRDGALIRIAIPALTNERRKEMLKLLSKMGEEAKIGIRNHRREENDLQKEREKKKEISEDELKRIQAEIQKIVDKYTAEVDTVLGSKEKEIMEV